MNIIIFLVNCLCYYYILKWIINSFYFVKCRLFTSRNYLISDKNKKEWVFISDLTNNIGKSYTNQFIELGYNIIGVVNIENNNKIEKYIKELSTKYNVEYQLIIFDYKKHENANITQYVNNIKCYFKQKNIKYFVNNLEKYINKSFIDIKNEEIFDLLNINCLGVSILNKMFVDYVYESTDSKSTVINIVIIMILKIIFYIY